jgi:hypothetical protein
MVRQGAVGRILDNPGGALQGDELETGRGPHLAQLEQRLAQRGVAAAVCLVLGGEHGPVQLRHVLRMAGGDGLVQRWQHALPSRPGHERRDRLGLRDYCRHAPVVFPAGIGQGIAQQQKARMVGRRLR